MKSYILILFIILWTSCRKSDKINHYLNNNLFKDDKGNIIFRIHDYENTKEQKGMTVKNDTLNFSHVYDIKTNEYKKNNDVIDWETFQNIFNNPENAKKAKEEQNVLSFDCYFEDKNNIYLYPFLGTKLLMIKGTDYEVLGGAYLKINNEIYWRAEKIEYADVKTFKTIKLVNAVDYYEASVGMDRNHLYIGNKIMSYNTFKERYYKYDELKIKYFKK